MTADEFKAWRKRMRVSLTQAAKIFGVNVRTVCRWQSGESRVPWTASEVARMLEKGRN